MATAYTRAIGYWTRRRAWLFFYANKLGMKRAGEMHFDTAANYFFAMEEDPSEPMLEHTHNHDRTI